MSSVRPTKSESIDKQNTRQLVLLDLSVDAGYALYYPLVEDVARSMEKKQANSCNRPRTKIESNRPAGPRKQPCTSMRVYWNENGLLGFLFKINMIPETL